MRPVQTRSSVFFSPILRAGSGMLILNVTGMGLAFLLQLTLARMLGAEPFGRFAYALAWINILSYFSLLGHDVLALRDIAVHKARAEWRLLAGIHRHAVATVAGVAVTIAGAGAVATGVALDLPRELKMTFLAGFAALPLLALVRLNAAILCAHGRPIMGTAPERIGRDTIVFALLYVSLLAGMPLTSARTMGFVAIASAISLALLYMLRLAYGATVPRGHRPEFRRRQWLKSALVLGAMGGIQLLLQRTDVVMLGWLRGPVEAGIYAVVSNLSDLVFFPYMAVGTIIAPMLAGHYARGDAEKLRHAVWTATAVMLGGALAIALPLGLLAGWVLALYGGDFAAGSTALRILLVAQCLKAALGPGYILLSMTGHERRAAWILAAVACVNIALNALLIPAFGLAGAAVATGLASFGGHATLVAMVWRHVGVVPPALALLAGRRARE